MAQGADEIIEQLIARGADLLAVTGPTFERNGEQNIGHSSLLHYACRLNDTKWANYLIARTPLHVAARLGNDNILETLVGAAGRLGIQAIDAVDDQGFTALGRAVYRNELDCARVLLKAKANQHVLMGNIKLDPVKRNIWLDDEGINIELNLAKKASDLPMTLKQFADLRCLIADNFKTDMAMSPHRAREIGARINKDHALASLFGPRTRKRVATAEIFAR